MGITGHLADDRADAQEPSMSSSRTQTPVAVARVRGPRAREEETLTHRLPLCVLRPYADRALDEHDRLDGHGREGVEKLRAVVRVSVGHELRGAIGVPDGEE